MDRCNHCGEMLLVEHHAELGSDRPAGEHNPTLVARCPNPDCPGNRAEGASGDAPARRADSPTG